MGARARMRLRRARTWPRLQAALKSIGLYGPRSMVCAARSRAAACASSSAAAASRSTGSPDRTRGRRSVGAAGRRSARALIRRGHARLGRGGPPVSAGAPWLSTRRGGRRLRPGHRRGGPRSRAPPASASTRWPGRPPSRRLRRRPAPSVRTHDGRRTGALLRPVPGPIGDGFGAPRGRRARPLRHRLPGRSARGSGGGRRRDGLRRLELRRLRQPRGRPGTGSATRAGTPTSPRSPRGSARGDRAAPDRLRGLHRQLHGPAPPLRGAAVRHTDRSAALSAVDGRGPSRRTRAPADRRGRCSTRRPAVNYRREPIGSRPRSSRPLILRHRSSGLSQEVQADLRGCRGRRGVARDVDH